MLLHSISCHCVLFNGIKWYWIVLHGAYNVMVQIMSWYCKVLHFIARHPIVLHGIVWYLIVLHWIDRYFIVLNDIAWCCVLLNSRIFFLNKIFLGPRRSNIRNFCCNCPWPTKFLGKYLFGTTRPPVYVQKWPNMLFSALFGCLVEKLPQSTCLPWKTLTP